MKVIHYSFLLIHTVIQNQKKLSLPILLAFFLLPGWATSQHCFTGDITFSTQAEIDAFLATNYTCISGNVFINEVVNNTIINLDGLAKLEAVGGNLQILNNLILPNFNGLKKLESVGGHMRIYDNRNISDLSGLDQLQSVGGFLQIYSNDYLVNLDGLDQLSTVNDLWIDFNPALTSLEALAGITSLNGYLRLTANAQVPDLSGLHNLTDVGGYVRINGMDNITSLNGLAALESIGGYLYIDQNAQLPNLAGLGQLNFLGGSLLIFQNDLMTSLNGLLQLTALGGDLSIKENPLLTDLDGLQQLTAINGFINIDNHAALTSLNGIDNIDPNTINDLYIRNSNQLSTCEVKSICDYLADPANPAKIFGNAPGCADRGKVVLACNSECAPIPLGLISWWDGDAVSVTTAGDIQSGYDGTMLNGTTVNTGNIGNAFSFDGENDYVSIPETSDLEITGPMTIEAWIKTPGTGNKLAGIVGKMPAYFFNGAVRPGYLISIDQDGKFRCDFVRNTPPQGTAVSTTTVTDDVFHHVAATYDGTAVHVYVDGVLEASEPYTDGVGLNNEPIRIGFDPAEWRGPRYFKGLIDEVSIYNRALAAVEIQLIYAAGSLGKCKPINFLSAANDLIEDNLALNVNGANGMINKINKALDLCQSGQSNQAINKLEAYINQVEGKRGNHLTDEEADGLIASAQEIIDAIMDGTIDCSGDNDIQSSNIIPNNFNITGGHPATLKVYPNPSHGPIFISFSNPKQQATSFTLTDAQGRVIWYQSFSEGEMPEYWKKEISLPPNNLYFLRTQANEIVNIEKIIMLR